MVGTQSVLSKRIRSVVALVPILCMYDHNNSSFYKGLLIGAGCFLLTVGENLKTTKKTVGDYFDENSNFLWIYSLQIAIKSLARFICQS